MIVSQNQYASRPWLAHYPQAVPHSLDYPKVPLYQLLSDSAMVHPDYVALIFFGRKTSYKALFAEAKRIAGSLVRLGLKKGERVAIMLPNCPQLVASYYGVLWAGGVVVMVNLLYTPRELQVQLRDSGARFIIALNLVYPTVKQASDNSAIEKIIVTGIEERLPAPLNLLYLLQMRRQGRYVRIPRMPGTLRYSELLNVSPLEQPIPVNAKEDLALLQYTGGTTGIPKGVMLTHLNLLANCSQLHCWVPPMKCDQVTIVGALPFFHAYGMTTVMNYGIKVGARIILFPRFELVRILKGIQRYKPQLFPGVPTMYIAINNYPKVKRFNLKSIEWCLSGAAALPLEVKEKFEQLTEGRLVEGYGLSEASPVTHANPLEGIQKSSSIGVPLPDTDCQVVDLNSGEPLPQGGIGELGIRGPQVMQGYWQKLDETDAILKDGWLHTGDIAGMDEDGYFYIVDRKKEMIKSSGFNVYPREVEEVLYQYPSVKEAAVIGVPDQYRGEAAKAFVVLKDGSASSSDEIIEWCRQRLAAYKVPREVEFVSELPKSLIGKVLRRVLMEQEQAKRAGVSGQPEPRAQSSNQKG